MAKEGLHMADIKNNQTGSIGLPEKEWFTLEEISERWGCSSDYLLHYGETNILRICFNFQYAVFAWFEYSEFADDGTPIPIQETHYQRTSGLMGICADDLKIVNSTSIGMTQPTVLLPNTLLPKDNKLSRYASIDWDIGGKPKVDLIMRSGLVIVRAERDRFEHEYRIGAYAGTMPDLSKPDKQPTYTTDYINIMHAAINEFFEPRRSVDAKKDEVVAWIKAQMTASGLPDSENVASAMFTIIKPSNHDPRKRRG